MQTTSHGEIHGFQYVETVAKKNRKRRNKTRKWDPADSNEASLDLDHYLEKRKTEMQKFSWLSLSSAWLLACLNTQEAPGPARRIICLALGSFSPISELDPTLAPGVAPCSGIYGLKQSQYQLSFLLEVIIPVLSAHQSSRKPEARWNRECSSACPLDPPTDMPLTVSFYDPAFTQNDKENLRRLGHTVLDEEPSLRCEEATFFYMPHAPKTLYERLVSENTTTGSLHPSRKIMLMGNDLQNYQKAMLQHERDSIPALMRIDPRTIQAHYPPDLAKLNQDTGVYFLNEICLQWFHNI